MGKPIVIDPEFRDLLPHPSAEDKSRLKERLELEGCRDPLVVWRSTGILLDGHTRKDICDEEDIGYKVNYVDLPTRELALQWVIDNQLARRNLTEAQKTYYLGMDYLNARKAVGHPQCGHSDHIAEPEGRTRDKVAAKHDVSPRTVGRAAKFVAALNKLPKVEKDAILRAAKGPSQRKVIDAADQNKPLMCKACKRKGQMRDCKACAELQKKAKVSRKTPQKTVSGKKRYDPKKFAASFGQVVRAIDDFGMAYGIHNSAEAERLRGVLKSFLADFNAWVKKAEAA